MAWVRSGDQPEQIKISFIISSKDHPELAAWVWRLPYRKTSHTIRDVLESAVKIAGGRETPEPNIESSTQLVVNSSQTEPQPVITGEVDVVEDGFNTAVSSAAAEIIGNFDTMFPGVDTPSNKR